MDKSGSLIRTKKKDVASGFKMLGFDHQGIRNLSKPQFLKFLDIRKEQENMILKKTPIIITTCKASGNRRLQ